MKQPEVKVWYHALGKSFEIAGGRRTDAWKILWKQHAIVALASTWYDFGVNHVSTLSATNKAKCAYCRKNHCDNGNFVCVRHLRTSTAIPPNSQGVSADAFPIFA